MTAKRSLFFIRRDVLYLENRNPLPRLKTFMAAIIKYLPAILKRDKNKTRIKNT
jgi:hypothetical protein